jgi:hypothetical protein
MLEMVGAKLLIVGVELANQMPQMPHQIAKDERNERQGRNGPVCSTNTSKYFGVKLRRSVIAIGRYLCQKQKKK